MQKADATNLIESVIDLKLIKASQEIRDMLTDFGIRVEAYIDCGVPVVKIGSIVYAIKIEKQYEEK